MLDFHRFYYVFRQFLNLIPKPWKFSERNYPPLVLTHVSQYPMYGWDRKCMRQDRTRMIPLREFTREPIHLFDVDVVPMIAERAVAVF